MKSKFSVGNRISHQEFGEGMIIQIKGNQLEILFLDEQRRSLSADSHAIKIIGSQNFEPIVNEPPIPSAANKIKKELDQLKEENRIEYFDYEISNRNKTQSFNKNSRVFHTLLGEGMITKILKNEYQIIFLNGNKQNIAINSPDLKMLSASTIDDNNEVNKDFNNLTLQNSNDLFVGKHISINEMGEGMISKINYDSYEIIFLDGHKETFPLQSKQLEKAIQQDFEIPVEKRKTSITSVSEMANLPTDDNIAVGKQITHPELGEGMVSKITNDSYEIIFLDGHRESFPLQKKPIEKIKNHDFEIPAETQIQKSKKTSNQESSFYKDDNLAVGKQITHPDLGEGMVSKITNDNYEIIFLDGHKESFPLQKKPIEKTVKHDFEIPVENQIQKNKKTSNEAINFNFENIVVGKQITHPELGEGMVSKITNDNFEVIFLDGHKENFPLNRNNIIKSESKVPIVKENYIEKPLIFEKNEKFELPIEKYQRTQEHQSTATNLFKEIETFDPREKPKSNNDKISKEIEKYRSDDLQIGSAVSHPKNGSGIVCNIDDYEIEVVFYNHKKIVYSSKNNELTFLNVNSKY